MQAPVQIGQALASFKFEITRFYPVIDSTMRTESQIHKKIVVLWELRSLNLWVPPPDDSTIQVSGQLVLHQDAQMAWYVAQF